MSAAVEPTTALTVVEPKTKNMTVANFAPQTFDEAVRFSKMVAASSMCPNQYRNKAQDVFLALQFGSEVGLSPMQAVQGICVVNNIPTLYGDHLLAVAMTSPDFEWHKEFWEGEGDTRAGVCQVKRKGHEVHEVRFTVSHAKTAKLWGKAGPWTTNPDRMLQLRARAFAIRDKFADRLKGIQMAEEAMDYQPLPEPKKVERGTMPSDIGLLTESNEPNRGHGNEGMKQEVVPPEKVSAPTTLTAFLIKSVAVKEKAKTKEPYLVVSGLADKNAPIVVYVWDKKFHPALIQSTEKICIGELSAGKTGDKPFLSLDHIVEIAGKPFVSDTPADATGELFDKPHEG